MKIQKEIVISGIFIALVVFSLIFTACKEPDEIDNFVAVTNITGVPSSTVVGTPLALTSTVTPNNATNKAITWAVVNAGTTGATITGNTLNANEAGIATVRATIGNGAAIGKPYVKDSTVSISKAFIAVTDIVDVPLAAIVGVPLTLNGTVTPDNATNQVISWTVANAGTTGATITGNTLNATEAGSATIKATIANGTTQETNYVKDFTITITKPFVAVTDITGVPSSAVVGTPLTLTSTVVPNNATNQTISWTV